MGIMNKMKTVDLGTLSFSYLPTWGNNTNLFYIRLDGLSSVVNRDAVARMYCPIYKTVSRNANASGGDMQISSIDDAEGLPPTLQIINHSYSTVESFKQAMQGVTLTYETIDSVEEEIINSVKTVAVPSWVYSTTYAYIFLNDRKPGANVAYAWNKPLPANLRFRFNSDNLGCVLEFSHAEYPTRASINAVMADKILTYQLNNPQTEEII